MLALILALALATAGTSLKITVSPDGPNGPSYTRTLRCAPVGGTLARRGDACRSLGELSQPFAPIPPGSVCTMIYGGPQRAVVTGTFDGRVIWARFARRDGCEIARWNKHKFLFAR